MLKRSVHLPPSQLFEFKGLVLFQFFWGLLPVNMLLIVFVLFCQFLSFPLHHLLFAAPCLPLTGAEHGSGLGFVNSFMALTRPLKDHHSAMHSPCNAYSAGFPCLIIVGSAIHISPIESGRQKA